MLEKLKNEVYDANMQLPKLDLVTFTWGNVSGIDRDKGLFVDLKGNVVEGNLNPSSDTPTHTVLYNAFPKIGGIVHTHSPWAVAFAAARMDIPALNTTHADTFYGDIPAAPALTKEQIKTAYEENTGKVIPAVLVMQHGPFTWGKTSAQAVYNAKVLEVVAGEDYHAMMLNQTFEQQNIALPQFLLDKHYYRKHGKDAYYGQNN